MLEEYVSVLMGSSHVRMLWVESVIPECLDSFHVTHILQVIVVPNGNLLDFVGCSEAIEEVDEWNLAADCCKMSYR